MNIKKLDGSFDIIVNNLPYNTIEGDKYFKETLKLYNEHPELFAIEKETIKRQPTYQELRIVEYGTTEEQLDMIYWDKVNGTNKWIEHITNVKEKYKKE